jgi:hypothetical protein
LNAAGASQPPHHGEAADWRGPQDNPATPTTQAEFSLTGYRSQLRRYFPSARGGMRTLSERSEDAFWV